MVVINYIVNYPFSAFLYTSIVILITLLSYLAAHSAKKFAQNLLCSIVIIILTLFAGFRGPSVGIDTSQYFKHIFNWQNNIANAFPTEPGLRLLSKITALIVNDPQFTIIIIALIINIFIVLRLWTLRAYISFPFAMFIYTTTYYVMTFSGFRQWIAIAIVFFGSKYIFKQKYAKFIIFVLIASLFHNTAILAILLLLVDILSIKLKSRKQSIKVVLSIIFSPLLLFSIVILENKINLLSQYSLYIESVKWNGSSGVVIWIRVFIGILIYLSFAINSKKYFREPTFFKKIYNIYLVGLLISIPGYYITNLSRIGLYFTIFETILFALIVKSQYGKKSLLFTFLIAAFSISLFILELAGSGRGHVPYIPFWEW